MSEDWDDYGLGSLRAIRAKVMELPVWDKRSVPGGAHVNRNAVVDIIQAAIAHEYRQEHEAMMAARHVTPQTRAQWRLSLPLDSTQPKVRA